jgi:hypothetical protein
MSFKLILALVAGMALLVHIRKLHHEGSLGTEQYYPKYMSSSEWSNYNLGGPGQ